MAAPAVIDPIMQKEEGDCVLACVAMVLGVSYSEVSSKALELFNRPHHTGLGTRDTQQLAKALVGRIFQSLRPSSEHDFTDDTGILFVKLAKIGEHAVVLFEGSVYDPSDGMLWSLHAYLATKKAHILRFLRP